MTESRTTPRTVATAAVVVPGTAMIAVTFGLARYGYGLLLPEMKADIGIGPSTAGLISSLGYLSYLVANAAVVPLGAWVSNTPVALRGGRTHSGENPVCQSMRMPRACSR
jgi:cyanate permease